MIGHPFQVFPFEIDWQVFLCFLTPMLLLTGIFAVIPLKPNMLQFELNAEEVIGQWTEADKIRAGFSLGLDFLYLAVYSTTISLACLWSAALLQSSSLLLASVGIYLALGFSANNQPVTKDAFGLAPMLFKFDRLLLS